MAIEIHGQEFVTANELVAELEITRQTLWRWRTKGHIPQGHRFRDGKTIFSVSEADEVRRYANRIEPIDEGQRNQLGLFN